MKQFNNPSILNQRCYIDGALINASSNEFLQLTTPLSGETLAFIPLCKIPETRNAIEAASKALTQWQNFSSEERSALLDHWASLIETNEEDLAILITMEQGKIFNEAVSEIAFASKIIRLYAKLAKSKDPHDFREENFIPLKNSPGVVAAIVPGDFPAAMLAKMCTLTLCAGCTLVARPSIYTPYTALTLAGLAEQVGFPAGVLNIVFGYGKILDTEFTNNPSVQKILSLGPTGIEFFQKHQKEKRIISEPRKSAACVVFDDVDMDIIIKETIASSFYNNGQNAFGPSLIMVQEGLYESFLKKFTSEAKKLRVGDSFEPDIHLGPLENKVVLESAKRQIEYAISKGANIACGGKAHSLGGLYFEPTVLTETSSLVQTSFKPTYGPIVTLCAFKTTDEAITLMNSIKDLLAVCIYSSDTGKASSVKNTLQCKLTAINKSLSLFSEIAS